MVGPAPHRSADFQKHLRSDIRLFLLGPNTVHQRAHKKQLPLVN